VGIGVESWDESPSATVFEIVTENRVPVVTSARVRAGIDLVLTSVVLGMIRTVVETEILKMDRAEVHNLVQLVL
jgi:hypothetical protein